MSLRGRPNVSKLEAARNVPKLIKALEHWDSDVSRDAAEALGRIGDVAAVEPLVALLQRNLWDVVRGPAAAGALGSIGDPRAVDALISALRDAVPTVSIKAERSLGSIRDPRAVDALISVLADGGERGPVSAAWALGSIGDPRAVDALISALADPDPGMRSAAPAALGSIGDPRTGALLMTSLAKIRVKHERADTTGYRSYRKTIAHCLAELRDPNCVKVALEALTSPKIKYAIRNSATMNWTYLGRRN